MIQLFPVPGPNAVALPRFAEFVARALINHFKDSMTRAVEELVSTQPMTRAMERRIESFVRDRGFDTGVPGFVAAINGLHQSDEPWAPAALDLLASSVCVNPSKCNLPERYFEAWLRQRDIGVTKLTGELSRWVNNDGDFVQHKPVGIDAPSSIDFLVERNGLSYWVSHKYGRVGGGHQNHQLADGMKHLENGKTYHGKRNETTTHFVLILDGNAYEKTVPQINAEMEDPRIWAATTDAFCQRLLRV